MFKPFRRRNILDSGETQAFLETGKKPAQDGRSIQDWNSGWALLSPTSRPLLVLLCLCRRRFLIKWMRELFPRAGDRANEMAQWTKELAAKPDGMSPILRAHMVEG